MGLVQQAVLDFDEEIQVPWRPRLVAVAGGGGGLPEEPRPHRPRSSGRSSSRVGVCRPAEERRPAVTARPPVVPRRLSASQRRRPGQPVRATHRRVRLTRRARLLATVLTLALGVAIGSWLGPLLGGGDLQLAGVQSVVVQPGDTLWSIAAGVAGTDDVRVVVDRIQRLNHLRSAALVPGQVIELP